MPSGSESIENLRLLLVETSPGSLDRLRAAWPDADVVAAHLHQAQGISDLVFREKIQMAICELSSGDEQELNVIDQVRRVHPHLPLVAVLPQQSFDLARAVFRLGADDVLVLPLDPEDLALVRDQFLGRVRVEAELARSQKAAERLFDDLVLLQAIGETTRSADNLQALLDCIVDLIQSAMAVDIVSLMLVGDDGALRISSAYGLPDSVKNTAVLLPGEGISGTVLESEEPVLINDLATDGRFPQRSGVARYRSGSLLSVPIRYQDNVLGVLNVNNKRSGEGFSGNDLDVLTTIAHQTALAIENLKLVSHLHQKNREVEEAHNDLMLLHQDRTRFVCSLSHELKTPLTTILGFSDLLVHFADQIDSERLRDYLRGIYDESKHLDRLLSGMLRLFSIDSGSEGWRWENIPLEECVRGVLGDYDVRMAEENLQLECDFPADLPDVWGARDKLEILVDALIDNAVKFNRNGGRLSVRASIGALQGLPAVVLQVDNQGQSTPPESARLLLQGYTQLGDLDTGKPSGVGIGLATSRAILRQMCGDIRFEPVSGEGTSIRVLLPVRETFEELKS